MNDLNEKNNIIQVPGNTSDEQKEKTEEKKEIILNDDAASDIPFEDDESEGMNIPRLLLIVSAVLCVIVIVMGIVFLILTDRESQNSTDETTTAETPAAVTASGEASPAESEETTAPPPETTVPETSVTTSPETEPSRYTYLIDISPYLQYIDTTDKQFLLLANRNSALGSNYAPTDLMSLQPLSRGTLRKNAAMALLAMTEEMKEYGISNVTIASWYRNYELQKRLYEKYLSEERERHPDMTETEIRTIVDTYSARPGTSDHQTGLTVDFSPVSESFESSKAFKFLKERGHEFGFILRYPKNKTDITGYKYEPWHWRFVGREAATYIHYNNITLEEYLGKA